MDRAPPAAEQQELFPEGEEGVRQSSDEQGRDAHRSDGLIPKYTFVNFVVGAGNQFAHAAAQTVARQPGERYNPLFIYGGVGLGKTHLANAIGHEILRRAPTGRMLYLSAESFMNELISALRRDRTADFKNRFRRIDVLILDDAQFLAGRERTQEEFFHTFNSLYESQRQIVLTSDKSPKEIRGLEERLRNRFEWGLIADIQAPDLETRVAIIEKKAEAQGIDLPHDVALFLANEIATNVRELEGCLMRLEAAASLDRVPITLPFATRILQARIDDGRRAITTDNIQRAVCDVFHISTAQLRSRKRTKDIAFPRQVAMYLCRRYTGSSYPVIGDLFGGRDHTTVLYAVNVIEERLKTDSALRLTIDRIDRLLQGME